MRTTTLRDRISTSAIALAMIWIWPWSCQQRQKAPPPVPPAPSFYEIGDRNFDSGEYAKAVEAYIAYLQENATPGKGNQDRVLLRLALAYTFPESPLKDDAQARSYLIRLKQEYPSSPYAREAELLLQARDEADRLRSEVQQRAVHLEQMEQELAVLRHTAEDYQNLQAEMEKLRLSITQREERIRQLSDELQRLKQIDMQRRPATLPP